MQTIDHSILPHPACCLLKRLMTFAWYGHMKWQGKARCRWFVIIGELGHCVLRKGAAVAGNRWVSAGYAAHS